MPTVTSYTKDKVDDLLDVIRFLPNHAVTADYTLVLSDAGKVIEVNSSSKKVVTIPGLVDVAYETGTTIYVIQKGAGLVEIDPGVSVTVRSKNGSLLSSGQTSVIRLYKVGPNEWYADGDLAELLVCNRQTGDYTLAISDINKCVEMNKATGNTLTVPTDASVPFPIGTVIFVTQYGAGTTSIAASGGVDLRSLGGNLNSSGQYSSIKLHKIDTNEWYVSGDLSA